tara:strand:+ start:4380 stop:6401 length:2022 start_codon:yes stop_codon:yes gene_type:complete
MKNPLLKDFKSTFGIPPFNEIKDRHYLPAFKAALKEHKKEIDSIINDKHIPNFENTINALENSGSFLSRVSRVFFNLLSAHSSEKLQDIANEITPLLSKHRDSISLNEKLFFRIEKVYQSQENLNEEQKRLVKITYDGFKLNGSNLKKDDRSKLQKINQKLSSLTLKFGQNTLKETNSFNLIIKEKSDLVGLPDDLIVQAKFQAEKENLKDAWLFKATRENLYPFLTFSENRQLREAIYKGYVNKGKNKNLNNNQKILFEIAELREQKAEILGFGSHTELALQNTMAENKKNVLELLNNVWEPATKRAREEIKEIQNLIQREGKNFKLEPWDWWFYSEKVRKSKFDYSEEEMRPYLSLDNIKKAAFTTAERLFDIKFKSLKSFPKYHEDIEAYKVLDNKNNIIGIFLTDYFARPSKQGGAWMTSYQDQSKNNGIKYPIVINICNFPKPTSKEKALLSFEQAITLFHEFGHGLHGLLSNVTYPSLSGTSVPRDYVEFPSQMLENWIRSPKVLKEFALHHKTKKKVPASLLKKYEKCQKFNQGFATTEYLAASYLDLAWHSESKKIKDIDKFEKKLFKTLNKPKEIDSRYGSTYFNHIFSGGYSSSYYSYMWSEVLDSSAFEVFEKKGLFHKASGKKLKELVYASGNSKNLMDQFIEFNGKKPDPKRLLQKRGLA